MEEHRLTVAIDNEDVDQAVVIVVANRQAASFRWASSVPEQARARVDKGGPALVMIEHGWLQIINSVVGGPGGVDHVEPTVVVVVEPLCSKRHPLGGPRSHPKRSILLGECSAAFVMQDALVF